MSPTIAKPTVFILGGGIAGMTAAHELIERGFDVTVFEARKRPGGKARGIPVPNSAPANRKPLPGEHGFRFFPGFYRHVPDTMSRIPCGKGRVSDNLAATRETLIARVGQSEVFFPTNLLATPADLVNGFQSFEALGIPDHEMAHFAWRLLVLLTSCWRRRFAQWENVSWWTFIGAAAPGCSAAFKKYCADGVTRSCVACRAELMSARSAGYILLQLLFDLMRPGAQVDRVLNGPTNEVWLDLWWKFLDDRGVRFRLGAEVKTLQFAAGRIKGITLKEDGNEDEVTVAADYYVAALPVERIVSLLSAELCAADDRLKRLVAGYGSGKLRTEWMNGIQYFLKEDVPLVTGHTLYIDSAWSLTSISQRQFWPATNLADYGDGSVRGVLSVDISDWGTKGLSGRRGIDCRSPEEIESEVRAQLKAHLNGNGEERLRDDNIVGWFVDDDIEFPNPGAVPVNLEPLLINTAGSYAYRPEAVTEIPNLFLAGDYVRTNMDLATMEAANESARRAVNGILKRSGSRARRCKIWRHQEPWIFKPLIWLDRRRWRKGLPNLFDDDPARCGPLVHWARRAFLAGWRATHLAWKGYRGLLWLLELT
jgi:uncharacterized protein with NAD-binding domain and iron-sulfur cluster